MDLKEVKRAGRYRSRRRVGRGVGSGLGKTSGRGHKGAGQRAGKKTPGPWFEGGQMPLYRRLPKKGFNNKKFRVSVGILNIRDLKAFEPGTEVTPELARSLGLLRKREQLLKVLGQGEIHHSLTVVAHRFSESARRKIEEAGGQARVIE